MVEESSERWSLWHVCFGVFMHGARAGVVRLRAQAAIHEGHGNSKQRRVKLMTCVHSAHPCEHLSNWQRSIMSCFHASVVGGDFQYRLEGCQGLQGSARL